MLNTKGCFVFVFKTNVIYQDGDGKKGLPVRENENIDTAGKNWTEKRISLLFISVCTLGIKSYTSVVFSF